MFARFFVASLGLRLHTHQWFGVTADPRWSCGWQKQQLIIESTLKGFRFPSAERFYARDGVWWLISFSHHCDILFGNFLSSVASSFAFECFSFLLPSRCYHNYSIYVGTRQKGEVKSAPERNRKRKSLKSLNFFCGWKFLGFVLKWKWENHCTKLGWKQNRWGSFHFKWDGNMQ